MSKKSDKETAATTTATSSAEKSRQHENYFGQTAQIFVDLGDFQLTQNDLRFHFDAFSSVAAFERGDMPFDRRRFAFEGEAFERFKAENAEVFDLLSDTALALIGVEPKTGWFLDYLSIEINNRVSVLIAVKDEFKSRRRNETLTGTTHDEALAAHPDLVQTILGLAWTHGKIHDSFLRELS